MFQYEYWQIELEVARLLPNKLSRPEIGFVKLNKH